MTDYPVHLNPGDTLNVIIRMPDLKHHPVWGGRNIMDNFMAVHASHYMIISNEREAWDLAVAHIFPLTTVPNMEVRVPGLPPFVIGQNFYFENIWQVLGFMLLAEGIPEIGMVIQRDRLC